FSARPAAVSFEAAGAASPIAPGAMTWRTGTLQFWIKYAITFLCPLHAQLLVHRCVAARIGKTLHLDDVPGLFDGIFSQLLERCLILGGDLRAAAREAHIHLPLGVVLTQRRKPLAGLNRVGIDGGLVGRGSLLVRRDVLLVRCDILLACFDVLG